MKYLLTALLFIVVLSIGLCQDAETLKQIRQLEKITYEYTAGVLKEEKMFFKTKEKYALPWQSFVSTDIQTSKAIIDTLVSRGKLSIETGTYSGNRLIFQSRFPMNMADIDKAFRLSVMESNLTDSLKQKLVIDQDPSVSFGSDFSSGYANGQNYSATWRTLNASFEIKSDVVGKKPQGDITFGAETLSKYDYAKITPKDIGKEFTLGGTTVKVIDVIQNKLVLAPSPQPLSPSFDLKFVNVNGKGEEIAPLTMIEMNELKKKDNTISTLSSGTSQAKVYKAVYDLFKSKPGLSFEDFNKTMDNVFVQMKEAKDKGKNASATDYLGPQYIVIKTAGPVENLFLYVPVYGEKMNFKIRP